MFTSEAFSYVHVNKRVLFYQVKFQYLVNISKTYLLILAYSVFHDYVYFARKSLNFVLFLLLLRVKDLGFSDT